MKIIIYTKTNCPWCAEVLQLLTDKKIPYEERNVSKNQKYFEELLEKSNQSLTPTLDIDGKIIADTDAEEVKKFLKQKGVIE